MQQPSPLFRCAFLLLLAATVCAGLSCHRSLRSPKIPQQDLRGALNRHSNLPFDSNEVAPFFKKYPTLATYSDEIGEVYRKNGYTHLWFDSAGIVEFGPTLLAKVNELGAEGLSSTFPCQKQVDDIFANDRQPALSPVETELMLTSLYLFYATHVVKGVSDSTTTAMGWLLPRKEVSYAALLDSLLADPGRIDRNDSVLFNQYYKLRDALKLYHDIEAKGGWKPVVLPPKSKGLKPGDTGLAVRQVRDRLFITGDLSANSGSNRFDRELEDGVAKFKARNGFNPGDRILPEHIAAMNVPVDEIIRKIAVNMERCRWISPAFASARNYIVVNIPAFYLTFVRNGKVELASPVVVGKDVTRTMIFSGMLRYIVFSPYWNLPQSIITKEVKPGMAKDKNYLEKHNMEWNNGQVRQKPGKNNSLGLVKFMFPNSNDIYMHDTPAKSLFEREQRAFSHGCIRVGRPRDLAIALLQDDPAWTPQRIDAAMHAGRENTVTLKERIPVYIGYMTAWVDATGTLNLYPDIYGRDGRLADVMGSK